MLLKTKNITRVFHKGSAETTALRGVSLDIENGEFVAIVGRSGAGKSTLLYQLSLLDAPTSGEVFLKDTSTALLSSKERTRVRLTMLGYVFQDYALLPELSAEENVMVPLLMQGVSLRDAKARAGVVLKRLGLGERLENLPTELSGGEQQRVSIARAIAHDPLVLFADEPTANLDSATSENLLCYFKELHESGQTIIMVTHELDYARKAERVIELSDGEIVFDGSPKEHIAFREENK